MSRYLPASLAVAFGSLALAALLHNPLASLEHDITVARYQLRPPQSVDSNIVLVYLDNEALRLLDWPVRRNFHALLIKALADLKARVIGVEVMVEHPHREYPEYDELLAGVIRAAGNVVLPSYFDALSRIPGTTSDTSRADPFVYPMVVDIPWHGTGLHTPLAPIMQGAAGIGHTSITGDNVLPPFIRYGQNAVPAFPVEILRIYNGAPREAVMVRGSTLVIPGPQGVSTIPVAESDALPNLPATLSAFTAYPFHELLRAYDALQVGRQPAIPVDRLKNKIVLVGVIAEGRSSFVPTTLHPRMPSLIYHAVYIDNALRGAFLSQTPPLLVHGMNGLFALAVALAILSFRLPRSMLLVLLLAGALVTGSLALFLWADHILPVTPFLLTALVGTVTSLVYKHRFVQSRMDLLEAEKERIAATLRDREAKVALLERELLDFEGARTEERTGKLLEEIRRYKVEIRQLASKAEDMERYSPEESTVGTRGEYEGIIYDTSGPMKRVVDFVDKIAGNDAPVLILGESGTGKELVAKAIHRRSQRSNEPFVAVNCGALAETLLESELFGHEKGAFTGAVKEKQGRFELADHGTIFLDEIGEVSEAFQLKILRVLQEGEFERVGGTVSRKVNVRVVAATNRNLREMVKAGRFREDLYYRLNVLIVELPPLREREGDIPVVIAHVLQREGPEMHLSRNVMETLCAYRWPGNIRELESAVKRAVLLARAERRTMITMKDLPAEISAAGQGMIAIEDQILETVREKKFSRSAITETAAELGGLNRGTVAEYLRGQFLKAFVEQQFNTEQTVRRLAFSGEAEVQERVMKRLNEYLTNIAEAIQPSQPWETVRSALKPKAKNLPQRYHLYLEQVGEAFFRGLWKLPPEA